jgi:hypothetical protein
MPTIHYDVTAHGVMVQVHLADPTSEEWTAMVDFMVARKQVIKAVLAIGRGSGGPNSKQREQLAGAVKEMHPGMPFALLTDSVVTRGILTALNWLTNKQDESRTFPPTDLEQALSFLKLGDAEKAATRALVAKLGAG